MARPKTYTEDLEWREIDPETLDAGLAQAYRDYKTAYRLATECRERFEAMMRDSADVGYGRELKFGYRFGKLSIAVGPVADKPKSAGKKAVSLSEWLDQQQQNGRSY